MIYKNWHLKRRHNYRIKNSCDKSDYRKWCEQVYNNNKTITKDDFLKMNLFEKLLALARRSNLIDYLTHEDLSSADTIEAILWNNPHFIDSIATRLSNINRELKRADNILDNLSITLQKKLIIESPYYVSYFIATRELQLQVYEEYPGIYIKGKIEELLIYEKLKD